MLIVDTGRQRSERNKWIGQFDCLNVVIHVVSMASYDKVLHEDSSKERLEDSIELFGRTTKVKIFKTVPFIFFLNKEDFLFENGRDLVEVFPGIGLGKIMKSVKKSKKVFERKVLNKR